MNFEWALTKLKAGEAIARASWAQDAVFLYLVPRHNFTVDQRPPLGDFYRQGSALTYQAHIDQRTANGTHSPWVATSADLLATDWVATRW